jgi:glyoxylase-like metal-dependent hydrolase (beta-lactamase superfamily II)
MKAISVERNLLQLTQLGSINCYLVREDDGFTLVDTCFRGAHRFILQFVTTANTPVKRIILTHAHPDHVGSLDALRERLPSVELIISSREQRLYESDFSLDAEEAQSRISRGSFPRCKTNVDRTVVEGDTIGSLRVISAPGHTPGQIALFDVRNSALIVGDAFSSLFGLYVAGHLNWLCPFPTWATWDANTAYDSAQRLVQIAPSYLVTGHGPVLPNPVAKMNTAVAKAKAFLRK